MPFFYYYYYLTSYCLRFFYPLLVKFDNTCIMLTISILELKKK